MQYTRGEFFTIVGHADAGDIIVMAIEESFLASGDILQDNESPERIDKVATARCVI